MRLEGNITKDGRFWLIEVPAFDAMTQGRTKREVIEMVKDLIETMANVADFEVTVYPRSKGRVEIGANSTAGLVALLLRRQRERQGLSLAQAAERLGQRSRNAYARYEQGRAVPTIEKLEELLAAIAPDQTIVWHFAA